MRILHLEDDPCDAELVQEQLRLSGLVFELHGARNREAYEAALKQTAFDLILSDFKLPSFDGMTALALVQAEQPGVPFILISGTLGEEQAVDCMVCGATDYVLKQRLHRLVPAVLRALSETRDRKKRLEAETALRASEAEFRAMFETASIGMAQADPRDGQFTRVNQKMCAITGYSAAELLQLHVLDITHPDDRQKDGESFQRVVSGASTDYRMEKRYIRKDGRAAWVNVNMTVIRDTAGQPTRTMATIEDITDRKQAEESQARLAMAVEQASESILITDANAEILYANPAFEKIAGYTRREIYGQNPRILKSGKQDAAFYQTMWSTLTSRQVWFGRMVNRHKNGTLYENEGTISPVLNAGGRIINYVSVKRDVTREVALEEQNRQVAKMEAVGQLAGGVAHDFNNQLGVIQGYTEIVLNGMAPGHPSRGDLMEIMKAARRSADLTRQLLAFSRKQAMEPVMLDVNSSIAGSLKMLNRLIGENIRLSFVMSNEVGRVYMDPVQLDQILTNLTVNARDAIAGIGTISIETTHRALQEADCRNIPDFVPPGDYVVLTVSDDGPGMAAEIQARIFEPFFTTKALGKGTGMGLATVYGIVKQNNGGITVRSALGQGTTFAVYLPRSRAAATATEEDAKVQLPTGTETILLAEDEEHVLKLIRRTLVQQGYTVLDAGTPHLALQISEQYPEVIHLLLTDVIMPDMSGKELAGRIQEQRPSIRVLYMSGYTADVMEHHGHLPAGMHVLSKPFPATVLAQHVRAALDTPLPTPLRS